MGLMVTLSWEKVEVRGYPHTMESVPVGFWENRVKELSYPDYKASFALPSRDEAARFTAEKIIEQQTTKADSIYTLPSSMQGNDVLTWVVNIAKERNVSFDKARFFHMDEYFPISENDQNSFRNNLRKTFFEPLAIRPDQVELIQANPGSDGDQIAAEYEAKLNAMTVDLVLAPIGPGHIAFDEPGTPIDSITHLTTLSPKTVYRDHVERGLDTPVQAISQGVQTLLRANRILFIDFSPGYNEFAKQALYGPINADNTASFLRTVGQKVEFVTTNEIASAVGIR
jgi:glucosamine-6-phosphate deaminase